MHERRCVHGVYVCVSVAIMNLMAQGIVLVAEGNPQIIPCGLLYIHTNVYPVLSTLYMCRRCMSPVRESGRRTESVCGRASKVRPAFNLDRFAMKLLLFLQ